LIRWAVSTPHSKAIKGGKKKKATCEVEDVGKKGKGGEGKKRNYDYYFIGMYPASIVIPIQSRRRRKGGGVSRHRQRRQKRKGKEWPDGMGAKLVLAKTIKKEKKKRKGSMTQHNDGEEKKKERKKMHMTQHHQCVG